MYPSVLAVCIVAPRLPTSLDKLSDVPPLDTPLHRPSFRIMHADVQRAEADAAQAEFVSGALTYACLCAHVAVLADTVKCPAAIHVATDSRERFGLSAQLVVF